MSLISRKVHGTHTHKSAATHRQPLTRIHTHQFILFSYFLLFLSLSVSLSFTVYIKYGEIQTNTQPTDSIQNKNNQIEEYTCDCKAIEFMLCVARNPSHIQPEKRVYDSVIHHTHVKKLTWKGARTQAQGRNTLFSHSAEVKSMKCVYFKVSSELTYTHTHRHTSTHTSKLHGMFWFFRSTKDKNSEIGTHKADATW